MIKFFLFILLFVSHLSFAEEKNFKANGYNVAEKTLDFTRYEKMVPGRKLKDFAMEAQINNSAESVLAVILNMKTHKKFLKSVRKNETIEKYSSTDLLQYTAFKLPFPFSDRDVISRITISVDKIKKEVKVDLSSVERPEYKALKGVIRAKIIHFSFFIKQLADNKSYLAVEYLVDPRGDVPSGLINDLHERWPKDTIKSLKKQLADPDLVATKIFE